MAHDPPRLLFRRGNLALTLLIVWDGVPYRWEPTPEGVGLEAQLFLRGLHGVIRRYGLIDIVFPAVILSRSWETGVVLATIVLTGALAARVIPGKARGCEQLRMARRHPLAADAGSRSHPAG